MNLTVPCTVAGHPATMWPRFATVTIVQTAVVATQLSMLTDPRLHLIRFRLFRRAQVLVARDRIEVKGDGVTNASTSIGSPA